MIRSSQIIRIILVCTQFFYNLCSVKSKCFGKRLCLLHRYCLLFLESITCTSRCSLCFWNQHNLKCFHTVSISFTSRSLSVFRPSKPSEILDMRPVINIVALRSFSGQANLNRLHSQAFGLRSCLLSILLKSLPAYILDMRRVFNSAGKFL